MALYRPYIRQDVREEVERRAERNEKGQFLDANTHQPIEGKYDLGHRPGHEHWREVERAEKEGLTQEEFNNRMNNPNLYQVESPHENRSHTYEMHAGKKNTKQENVIYQKSENYAQVEENGGKVMDKSNSFLESLKVDQATIERCNAVSKNAAKNANTQASKTSSADDGGRELGDTGPGSLGRESGNKSGGMSNGQEGSNGGHGSNGQGSSGQGTSGHGSGGQGGGGQGDGGHGTGGNGGH